MGGRSVGIALVAAGVVILLVGLFADSLGIGVSTDPVGTESESPVFGWKQVLAVVGGAVLVATGFLLVRRPQRPAGR